MKPRRGEKPPLSNSSRAQSCLPVRSHEAHSREWDLSSAERSAEVISCTNSPPWAGIRWLVEVKTQNLLKVLRKISGKFQPDTAKLGGLNAVMLSVHLL